MTTQPEETPKQLSRASFVSLGAAIVVLFGAIEFTWRMAGGLSDMRNEQTKGFESLSGEIRLLKYQLEQQASQIMEIRSSIGSVAPAKR